MLYLDGFRYWVGFASENRAAMLRHLGADIMWVPYITVLGLACTLIGAIIIAKAVVLSEDDALRIGISPHSGSREEDLKLPHVQSLLAGSHRVKWGVIVIALGTVLQMVPPLAEIFAYL